MSDRDFYIQNICRLIEKYGKYTIEIDFHKSITIHIKKSGPVEAQRECLVVMPLADGEGKHRSKTCMTKKVYIHQKTCEVSKPHRASLAG